MISIVYCRQMSFACVYVLTISLCGTLNIQPKNKHSKLSEVLEQIKHQINLETARADKAEQLLTKVDPEITKLRQEAQKTDAEFEQLSKKAEQLTKEKKERREKAERELATWTAEIQRDAEYEVSRAKQVVTAQNNNVQHEFLLYKAWNEEQQRGVAVFRQEYKAQCSKGYAQHVLANKRLDQKFAELCRLARHEKCRFRNARNASEQVLKQEIERIVAKVKTTKDRIARESTGWTKEQKAFWNHTQAELETFLNTWITFKDNLQKQYLEIQRLWDKNHS